MAGFTHGMSNIELDVRKKRFNTHASPGITFERPARAETEDGAGIGSRKGDPRSGEDRRNPPSPSGARDRNW